jgi:hypothetical protein
MIGSIFPRLNRWPRLAAALLALMLAASLPAVAQRYTVQEAGLDGGGGRVTAGTLALTSSLGGAGPVGRVRTDRYVLYSGMPSPFAGQVAILVIHEPAADGAAAEGGTDRTVTARIVTNNAPLESATLYYRSGQATEATAVAMTPDEAGFVAVIPGEAIGAAGLTYYFVAVDEEGTTIRAPRTGVYSLPVRVGEEEVRRPAPQPGGDTQAAYRLLSMPIVLDDARPEAVLGDDIPTLASPSAYDPTTARLFEPIGTRVAEYPGTGPFELGRAFWLIVRDEVETIDAGAGTSRALDEPVRIDLSRGWNFVGTPFAVSVPVANLRTTSGAAVTLRAYGPDGYNTPDDPVTAMTPFEGYAVFAETATTLVVNPPLPASEQAAGAGTRARGAAVAKAAPAPFPWRLRIRGASRGGRDADNVAAVHAAAQEGWDAHDWPEPPALASGLTIAFDPPNGAPADVTLSVDTRAVPTRGITWPLTVRTDAAGPVRLSVEGVDQVPAAFEVWLLDTTTKDTWNLRRTPRARLAVLTEGATRPMRLVVGTKTYVSDVLQDLEALPRTYALEPPYPNPSTGPVALQVGLPADDRVTIEVYNVLGQRVATIKDGEAMPAGYHTVVWTAPHLASGLYFVRMEAGDYRATQKLVRVR